jgi:hypothetical protein
MNPYFLRVSIGALDKTHSAWAAAGLESEQEMIGGLVLMWASCWRGKRLELEPIEVCGFFNKQDLDAAGRMLLRALTAYGFMAPAADGRLHVIDEKDRLGIQKHRNRQAGAAKARAKKGGPKADKTGADGGPVHQDSINVDRGVDLAHDQPLIRPSINARSTLIQASHIAREPENRDHDLLEPPDPGLLPKAAEKPVSPGEAERAAFGVLAAGAAVSGRSGDHVAREAPPSVDGFRTPSQADFIKRFTAAFRANTPPEPQESPPEAKQPAPRGEVAPPPIGPPISPRRPLESAKAQQPPLPPASLGDVDFGPTEESSAEQPPASPDDAVEVVPGSRPRPPESGTRSVDQLQRHLAETHQRLRGHAYRWKEIDRAIIEELLAEQFSAGDITEWWAGALGDKGRNIKYLRELKALMLKEAVRQSPAVKSKRDPHPEAGMIQSTNSDIGADVPTREGEVLQ